MNQNWLDFLSTQQGTLNPENTAGFPAPPAHNGRKKIYPLTHLGVITVTGPDAANLLQGQVTCNINDVTGEQGKLAAMCNAKGRAIVTFLIIKKEDNFLLIVPVELAETMRIRLQMYVLRSKVKVKNSSLDYCLMGLSASEKAGYSVLER